MTALTPSYLSHISQTPTATIQQYGVFFMMVLPWQRRPNVQHQRSQMTGKARARLRLLSTPGFASGRWARCSDEQRRKRSCEKWLSDVETKKRARETWFRSENWKQREPAWLRRLFSETRVAWLGVVMDTKKERRSTAAIVVMQIFYYQYFTATIISTSSLSTKETIRGKKWQLLASRPQLYTFCTAASDLTFLETSFSANAAEVFEFIVREVEGGRSSHSYESSN